MGFSQSFLAGAAGCATIGMSKSRIDLELGPLAGMSFEAFGNAEAAGQAATTDVTITDGASITAALAYRRVQSLTVDGTCAIAVSLPNLRRCVNALYDGGAAGHTALTLAGLVESGSFTLDGCPIATLDVSSLESCDSFSADGCPALVSLSLPRLTSCGNFAVGACVALETLSAPAIVTLGGDMAIQNNTDFSAASLGFGSLVAVGGAGNAGAVTITGNTGLTNAVATALVAQLVGPPAYSGVSTINTNDP